MRWNNLYLLTSCPWPGPYLQKKEILGELNLKEHDVGVDLAPGKGFTSA